MFEAQCKKNINSKRRNIGTGGSPLWIPFGDWYPRD